MKTYLSTLGILMSTIGSFLVWKYLTELNWADKEAFMRGEGLLTVPSPTEADVKRFRRQLWLSKFGLALILLGGGIQVVGNHYPDRAAPSNWTVIKNRIIVPPKLVA